MKSVGAVTKSVEHFVGQFLKNNGSTVLPLRRVAWRRGASLGGRVGVGEFTIECMKWRAIMRDGMYVLRCANH